MQPYATESFEIGSFPACTDMLVSSQDPFTGSSTLPSIRQPETGYRFSEDPFLLVNHALPQIHEQLNHRPHPRPLRILDIGTGSGVIPLLLLFNLPKDTALITAIELQERLFHVANENIQNNQMTDRITLIHGDVKKFSLQKNIEEFDMVISNPPYIKRGGGRLNPDHEKAVARHEIALTLDELLQSASRLLKPRGQLFLIYPTQRLKELIETMKIFGIVPSGIRWIHTRPGSKAKLFVITGINGGSETLLYRPPLYLTPPKPVDRNLK